MNASSLFTITFFVSSGVMAHFIRNAASLPACGKNEVRMPCGDDCESRCGWEPSICSPECIPNKCMCRFNYVRNSLNQCVRHHECTDETARCPEGMEFHQCGANCQRTCKDPEAKHCEGYDGCDQNVCRCKEGLVKMDGVCVELSECPALQKRRMQFLLY